MKVMCVRKSCEVLLKMLYSIFVTIGYIYIVVILKLGICITPVMGLMFTRNGLQFMNLKVSF